MNVIYVSNTCSAEKYAEYVEKHHVQASQQAQKYNLLLAEGMAAAGADVQMISGRPITRRISGRKWYGAEEETKNGVLFSYVPFLNLPLLRNLWVFAGVFFRILFSERRRKETIVIGDMLNFSAAAAMMLASFFRGYRTVGIVTDVPCYLAGSGSPSLFQRINLWMIRCCRAYLLLTAAMNEIVNPGGKPSIVLEGHADIGMKDAVNTLEGKENPRVCLYAGLLMKIYGIANLVEGFMQAELPDTELHIYGSGDYVDELKEIARRNEKIRYMGIAPNREVVEAELRATLLINPRPTGEVYVRYSFPSKNMEYMVSGTPVLTTRLPGMPEDHYPYVYFIDDEAAEGMKEALVRVLGRSDRELHEFGMKARSFILETKNNCAQAEKVLAFAREVFGMKERKSGEVNGK